MNRCLKCMAVLAVTMLPVSANAASVGFYPVGDLPGGNFFSQVRAVSADGNVVAGFSNISFLDGLNEAFTWTVGGGIQGLGFASGHSGSNGRGISGDGSVVAGVGRPQPASGNEAVVWTQSTGVTAIGDLPGGIEGSVGRAISDDGLVVVGHADTTGFFDVGQAFRWTSTGGMVGLGDLPGGAFSSNANGVNADGSIVVGYGHSAVGIEAFRWELGVGMTNIGALASGSFDIDTRATAVTPDGNVVVGSGLNTSGINEAFIWDLTNGMTGLGTLDGESTNAFDVSADGLVVVGSAGSGRSFIWDSVNGMRDLKVVIVNELGVDLSGWTLTSARAISDDGTTIAGWGTNPDGNTEGWVVTLSNGDAIIPEPASALLVSLSCCAVMTGRRRRWTASR